MDVLILLTLTLLLKPWIVQAKDSNCYVRDTQDIFGQLHHSFHISSCVNMTKHEFQQGEGIIFDKIERKYPRRIIIVDKQGVIYIKDKHKYSIEKISFNNYRLKITNATYDDAGSYSCNRFKQRNVPSMFNIIITGEPKLDVVGEIVYNRRADFTCTVQFSGSLREESTFQVNVNCNPPLLLIYSSPLYRERDGDLNNVKKEYAVTVGERHVNCWCEIVAGDEMSFLLQSETRPLNVQYAPYDIRIQGRHDMSISDNTWTCMANGNPKPKFKWTGQGETIEGQVLQRNSIQNLTRLPSRWTCIASNLLGESSQAFTLKVDYGNGSEVELIPITTTTYQVPNDIETVQVETNETGSVVIIAVSIITCVLFLLMVFAVTAFAVYKCGIPRPIRSFTQALSRTTEPEDTQ